MARSPLPPLLYADTGSSADQLYFSRVEVHDPFIAFGVGSRRLTVQSALEFSRVNKARTFDEVLRLEEWRARAENRWPGRRVGPAEIIAELAHAYRVKGFRVSDDFPASLYIKLNNLGVRLELAGGELFPEREIKSAAEAAAIREGNRLSAVGYTVAEKILRQSKIRGRSLLYQGKPLTSERLRFAIESAILEQGGNAGGSTIVAGGDQACDPHQRGFGPLRPHELIILDIFPRVTKTGYFGDMTRTFLRGRASDAQKKLVAAVRAAQLAALKLIRADIDGRTVHQAVVASFDAAGFKTERTAKGSVGFFHGTGHGLGLAVHEMPRMSPILSMPLKKGAVVTVEPGLYYPGLGGARIEDVVQVTARAPKMLSSYHYNWEL
ncbi:MAG: aminopeptidase P family protein [Verrucomicrobia bacterium]|nr:aminopeptidase P family protein [Verrucomicrobiota bacterium]